MSAQIVQHAIKLMTVDGHSEVNIMARGLAIPRGFSLLQQLTDEVCREESEDYDRTVRVAFGFQDNENDFSSVSQDSFIEPKAYLHAGSKKFAHQPDSVMARFKSLMRRPDAKRLEHYPCTKLTYQPK